MDWIEVAQDRDWIELAQDMDRLRWIFRKWDVGVWTGSSWLRMGTGCDGSSGSGMLGYGLDRAGSG